ncbi:hypothetical protein AM1BK_21750 [Neobacillus kokaensis]|uniref:Uncharacterized protein n=1 Tax=Neobacillus kokaensis TaxID=2759023 RepID=A0ABQ3N4T8_9BACI|nr:hypothetical protein AM1BK_21750 [Neobacillus kokaensis]
MEEKNRLPTFQKAKNPVSAIVKKLSRNGRILSVFVYCSAWLDGVFCYLIGLKEDAPVFKVFSKINGEGGGGVPTSE